MIHLLSLQNWAKHHGKTFTFSEGLNLIKGENESGKTLLLEGIDYALHGTVALRLPVAMYSPGLFACLITTIGNIRYRIERSPKKVELYNDETNEVVAKGARPVEAEIRRLLGYNRNVFLMANYSCQDQISYLSSMTPAERKRTIDNVVGLTSVEQVIKQHKEELTVLNRLDRSLSGREVEKPEQPLFVRVENVDALLAEKREKITQYLAEHQAQTTLRNNLNALLQYKPVELPKPDVSSIIPGWTAESIAAHKNLLVHVREQIAEAEKKLAEDQEPTRLPKPNTADLIEGLTQAKIEAHDRDLASVRSFIHAGEKLMEKPRSVLAAGTFSLEEIEAAEKEQELYNDWVHVQNLKAKGTIQCGHCGGEVHLATDSLAPYPHLVNVDSMAPPQNNPNKMRQVRFAYLTAEAELASQQETQKSFTQREAELVDNWYTEEQIENHRLTQIMLDKFNDAEGQYYYWTERTSGLKKHVDYLKEKLKTALEESPSVEKLDAHLAAAAEQLKYEVNQAELQNWQQQYDSLGQFAGEEALANLLELKGEQEVEIAGLETSKNTWAEYDRQIKQYNDWYEEYSTNRDAVEAEQAIVDALQDYKGRIKSSILPSVNAVATTWIKRMSEGRHFKVELTDNMEILVNDEPIEALSISGRALGHLALRMALGQVLTTRVYPVFIADEVDASMRDNRAQGVLNALTDMLKGSVKQIIMISHRELDHEANVIEV